MRMKFRLLWILTGAVIISFGAVHSAAASDEYVQDFRSRIKLSQDNTAAVTERIVYDFGEHRRHGIYREIPTRYFTGEEEGYETEFELESVARAGEDAQHRITEEHGSVRIRVGDPEERITGQHTYTIRYSLQPVVLSGGNEDTFRLDVTGNGWDVPIRNVHASLISQPGVVNATCYTGEFGEDTQECTTETDNHAITYIATERLTSGEGVTIEAAYPSDSFSQYPETKLMEREEDGTPWVILGLVGLFGAGVLAILGKLGWSYLMYRKRRVNQTVVPQYEPPAELKPAEVGLLSDNDSDTTEFTATLIDVATRGYVTIERQKDKKLFFFTDTTYHVHKQKPFNDLEDFERDILDALFSNGDSVDMESVNPQKMNEAIKRMNGTLTTRLERKGYYREKDDSEGTKVIKLKGPKSLWIIGLIIVGLIMFIYPLLLFGVMIAVLFYGVWRYTSLHARVTEKGFSGWAHVEGFKQFLSVTQKERLAFRDAPERDPEQFSEYLPYAIALGVEEEWAKQFADIDVTRQQHWYSGSGLEGASIVAATSSLSGGIKDISQSNFSSGSSTGSGGSFSGGGVGGGGGGSW